MGTRSRNRTRREGHAERRALRGWGSRRAEARRGLVYGPYLTADSRCSITTAAGGACTQLRRKYAKPRPHTWSQPRGHVREFSRKSRTRLQQTLCAMPIRHVASGVLFVTLTYPAAYPGRWPVWKRQLDSWIKRLRRRLPRAAGVWKLEPQKRGAPHFHLLLVGAPYMAKDWLSQSWYQVVNSGDPKHLAAGTNVQLAHSHRGVVAYAAKYVAKAQFLPADWQDGVGRWWGVFNREGLGIVWQSAGLTQTMYWSAVRAVRGLVRSRSRTKPRGPPRSMASGTWAVMRADTAVRLYVALAAAAID